jgi:ribonucleotide monophosphatase NagD (HAD superfamily)
VIFIGNQLNTDIRGANRYGIKCVWLSGRAHRSPDDTPNDPIVLSQARPTHVIQSLDQLPALLEKLV